MTCAGYVQCSNSKIQRKITKQEQCEHGPLRNQGRIRCTFMIKLLNYYTKCWCQGNILTHEYKYNDYPCLVKLSDKSHSFMKICSLKVLDTIFNFTYK